MKPSTKRILILLFISFLMIWGGEEFLRREIGGFAGSYPFAKTWMIDINESALIEIIKEIKTENPNLQPPNQKELTRGRASGFRDSLYTLSEYQEQHRSDSTIKFPQHNDSNSLGNADNGWTDYWYYIDFYYPDTKEIVQTWTRPGEDTNTTAIALVAMYPINGGIEGRLINRDFWYLANKIQIHKFKTTIIDRINAKIERRRNAPSRQN